MMSAKELQEFNKNRKITQVCYVTNDYKKTIEYLTNTLNWGPWTILKNNQISAHDVKSDGKPVEGDFEFLIAATFIGDIEFEIIQPIHGVNPYSKFLEERGPGIHHIKESILDNDALDAAVAEYSSRGPKVNYQGKYMEDHYFYLDTFDALGAYYETVSYTHRDVYKRQGLHWIRYGLVLLGTDQFRRIHNKAVANYYFILLKKWILPSVNYIIKK